MSSNWNTNKNNIYYENNNGSVSINTDKPAESSFFLPQTNSGLYPVNQLNDGDEYGYQLASDLCGQFLFVSAIGQSGPNGEKGAVYGFKKGINTWDQFTTIYGSNSSTSFGSSLSMSMPYLVIGSSEENSVYVYTYSYTSETWDFTNYKKYTINQQGTNDQNELTSSSNLGQCVSISTHPNDPNDYILIASSTITNTCYYGNKNAWENYTLSKVDQGSSSNINFGFALKTTYISENGNFYPFYLIGSPGFNVEVLENGVDTNIQGAGTCVYIYRNSIININSSLVTQNAGFGFSLAIGRNANYLAIGSPFFNNNNIQGGLVEIIYLNSNKKKGNVNQGKTIKYYLSNPTNKFNKNSFGYSFDFNFTTNSNSACNLTIGNYDEGSLYFYGNNFDSFYDNYVEITDQTEAIKPNSTYFSDVSEKIGYQTITNYNTDYDQFNVFTSSPRFTTDSNIGYILQLVASGKYIFNVEGTTYLNGFLNVNGNNYNYAINSENTIKNPDISNHLMSFNKPSSSLVAFDPSYDLFSTLYSFDNKNQQASYCIGLLHKTNETDILAISRKIGETETILFALDTSGVTYYTKDGINNLKNLVS